MPSRTTRCRSPPPASDRHIFAGRSSDNAAPGARSRNDRSTKRAARSTCAEKPRRAAHRPEQVAPATGRDQIPPLRRDGRQLRVRRLAKEAPLFAVEKTRERRLFAPRRTGVALPQTTQVSAFIGGRLAERLAAK